MIGAAPRYFSASFDLNIDSAQPNDILAESGPPTSRSAAFRREAPRRARCIAPKILAGGHC
jgi:hypothetical protein